MTKFTAQIVNKHRVTIPKNIRAVLDLDVGDYVEVDIIKVKEAE